MIYLAIAIFSIAVLAMVFFMRAVFKSISSDLNQLSQRMTKAEDNTRDTRITFRCIERDALNLNKRLVDIEKSIKETKEERKK